MDEYSVKNTQEALRNRLISYLETAYFGKNDELRKLCKSEIEKQGTLWREPFIEANPSYLVVNNGINKSTKIPNQIKTILNMMIENGLGVYKHPYLHQVQSLESFYDGKDLFVATGTGSGKTECFMWPMISKLINEAKNNELSWQKRGVRAMMLYPMNALVADQIARLRRMIGTDDFNDVFAQYTGGKRRPQFGMYTGRTPYAGETRQSQDKALAQTLTDDLVNRDEETINQLVNMGKYPAKKDLAKFIDGLTVGKHITESEDAEMITRFEMQRITPDILITNYSMLEYMLMRQEEQKIWQDTKSWLDESSDNKLLFIIDEAHMYRGAAGGEVALLIRRFLHKLNISRDRIQFILTSASIPQNENDKVYKFIKGLTAIESADNSNIDIIVGERDKINYDNSISVDVNDLCDFDVDKLHGDEKLLAIKELGNILQLKTDKCTFLTEKEVEQWLYEELPRIKELLLIMEKCRGKGVSFIELSHMIFPNASQEKAEKATSVLLSIAPMAKNKEGQVLFPSRLHMMFRGISGVYACVNPQCTEKNHSSEFPLGKVYLGQKEDICKCGGKVYELINDRTCGAIFIKGYIDEGEPESKYVWNKSGILPNQGLKEIHYYIITDEKQVDFGSKKNVKTGWLNAVAGRIETDDTHAGCDNYLHVAYSLKSPKDQPKISTFPTCPKCKKSHLRLIDFSTKGNEPFFHLVSEQLMIQPPIIKDPEKLEMTPNAGRKVLLFSDSRQRAATLAKELTDVADEDAMRKAIVVAAKKLEDWAIENKEKPCMDLLYISFLRVALDNKLRFFFGSDEVDLHDHMNTMKRAIQRGQRRGKEVVDYVELRKQKFATIPELYSKYLLKIICSNFRSFTDLGLCWIEPCSESLLDEIYDEFDDNNIELSEKDFFVLFAAWVAEILTDSYAYDYNLKWTVRRSITNIPRFGISADDTLPKRFENILKEKGYTDKQQSIIYEQLLKFTQKGNDDNENRYLNPQLIAMKYDSEREWCKCPKCERVFPFSLWGKCVWCGSGTPYVMSEDELEGLEFWRQPIIDAVNGKKDALMTRINTEEHTAQLSHKDQRATTWSTTEEYELRFQNVYIDDKEPVDVLSCTTTMEVGIDIGSLTAVGLRNIPPMRENYQQRAGRAGRRGSSISTIVTYTDVGPHDSYYFNNPEKIISGEPRAPFIDIDNGKLIYRHLNVVFFTEFFNEYGTSANLVSVFEFFNEYYDEFISYIDNIIIDSNEYIDLIPGKDKEYIIQQKGKLKEALFKLKEKVTLFESDYYDSNNEAKTVLDVMLEEGVFPTYSFPRNVVGFSIENLKGDKVEQEPDRSLDMAISEYAPGRLIVVNKQTYKSGGIYNFHSKFLGDDTTHPARKYFNNKEYFKPMYYCTNTSCNWVGDNNPGLKCPFCSQETIGSQHVVKPWGFAPVEGRAIRAAEVDSEITYAELPSYASPIKDEEMIQSNDYKELRYGRLSDQPLTILNEGPDSTGFTICKDCGAAVPGDDDIALRKIRQPYNHPRYRQQCTHPDITNAFLGDSFLTDMVLFEIQLSPERINTKREGMWVESAVLTLSEAMVLAAGQLLDVEFNDLKSGYRLRYYDDKVCADIFLFDSLSSGAGYSSMLTGRVSDLLKKTYEVLNCKSKCATACHDCLKHYWNQRVQNRLDRHLAKQLLDWAKDNTLAEPLSFDIQKKLLMGIKETALLDSNFDIIFSDKKIYGIKGNVKKEIYVYPSMWSENDSLIPDNSIAVSDKMIINSMPKAYSQIRIGLNS